MSDKPPFTVNEESPLAEGLLSLIPKEYPPSIWLLKVGDHTYEFSTPTTCFFTVSFVPNEDGTLDVLGKDTEEEALRVIGKARLVP
jgi:hypothetical protein